MTADDKVANYLQRATDRFKYVVDGTPSSEEIIEIAKMIQIEEHSQRVVRVQDVPSDAGGSGI